MEQKAYNGSTQVGGSTYKAKIVNWTDADDSSDLALLQIRSDRIPMNREVPILPKGEEALRGERVYVIGNPAGQDGSVTQGIIVSTARESETRTGEKRKMLQTDAEIFYGNSGGVLMRDDGRYLGTVSRGIPGTAVVFAIHYEHVHEILKDSCYAELYDPDAETFEVCDKKRVEEKEVEEESVKSLLKKLVKEKEKSKTPHIETPPPS